MNYKHFVAGLLLLTGSLMSCKKEKSDYFYDHRPVTNVQGNSLVRLVNLTVANQLIVNGDSLTNFKVIAPLPGGGEPQYPGTPYFPDNGRLGTTWTIPRQLLQSGKATIVTDMLTYQGPGDPLAFDVEENNNAPVDYYMVQGNQWTVQDLPRVIKVPRSESSPEKAGYFKIRLLNLADELKPQSSTAENVAGPLTLTYADGTPVSTATSAVASRQASAYVEVPYGTYQFRVLTAQGTQVSATGGTPGEFTDIIDPATSTLVKAANGQPHTVSTNITYAPVKTYQAGGVYTIVVGAANFITPYYQGNPGETITTMQNGFRIIPDINEPANTSYTRLQAAHVLPGEGNITVKVNGKSLSELAYAAHSEYQIFVAGQAGIEAVNAQGTVIASLKEQLGAGLNYTAWVYRRPDGQAAISLVSNNLSGSFYYQEGNGQDGVNSRRQLQFPFNIRFLNFCSDLPYVSFTSGNGQPLEGYESTRNLEPGKIPVALPYVRFGQSQTAYQFMAYRSSPGVYPGNWLSDIAVLKSTDFIARPALYVRGSLPAHEPGVFSVALIGQLNNTRPEAQKAKMIIVKHTK
jgi:hypothetical protein